MFNFMKKKTAGPPAHTSLEQQDLEFRLQCLELRIAGIEQAILTICEGFKYHMDRIDHNTKALDKNMHNLAAMTLRPPKDLLNGNNEAN